MQRGEPLINLQSDLRRLSNTDFGAKEPFVTKDLPAYHEDGPKTTQAGAREDDTKRITDLIRKSNQGSKFSQNLALLTATTQQGNIIKKVLGTAGQSAKVIGATLAQIPVSGTGTHFIYGFNGFTYLSNPSNGPISKFAKSGLGKFVKNNLGIAADGIKGAERVTTGRKVILDNDKYDGLGGDNAYNFSTTGKLEELNSKFDLKEGSDEGPSPLFGLMGAAGQLVSDIASAASFVGGLFKKKGKNIQSPAVPNENGIVGYSGQTDVYKSIKAHNVRKDKKNYRLGQLNSNERSIDLKSPRGPEGDQKIPAGVLSKTPASNTLEPGTEHPGSKLKDREDLPKYSRAEEDEKKYLEKQAFNQPKQGDSTILVAKELSNTKAKHRGADDKEAFIYAGQEGTPLSISPDQQDELDTNYSSRTADSNTPNVKIKTEYIPEGASEKYKTDQIWIKTRLGQVDATDKKVNDSSNDYITKLASAAEENVEAKQKQIIPFEFQIVEPDATRFLYFRAYLDSFSDNYTGDWNSTKYVGRAEDFHNYTGFSRDVQFAFKVAAESKEELKPLYKKINYLVGATAPSYNTEQSFMRGTLVKLTVGDYLKDTFGFFPSIGLSWDVTYPWEINLEDSQDLMKVPHLLNVDVSFTPIHNFAPKTTSTFIGVNNE